MNLPYELRLPVMSELRLLEEKPEPGGNEGLDAAQEITLDKQEVERGHVDAYGIQMAFAWYQD